jgi:hypothetical protein
MLSHNNDPRLKDWKQFNSMMEVFYSEIIDQENLSFLVLGGSDDDIHSLR